MKVAFLGVLTIIFIGLKLTGHILWSWWWVFSPVWITLAICLVSCILMVLLMNCFERIELIEKCRQVTRIRRH